MTTAFIEKLGIRPENAPVCTGRKWYGSSANSVSSFSPVDGKLIAKVGMAERQHYEQVAHTATSAFKIWQTIPAPKRGDLVRRIGDALREKKKHLGELVSYEMGKSLQEGWGEVQEMIDICDFAVGLSRQLCGSTMHSERPKHRMYEQWHPLGPVGVITAFNFPVAVWAWNAMIATVCGDVTIWKPSEKTPLSALACFNILADVLAEQDIPEGVFNLIVGDIPIVGEALLQDSRIPLISATGSTRMGRRVAEVVGKRLGRTILELGGNNAVIVSSHADLKATIPPTVFGAVGTAGQRCTSVRRVIIHTDVYDRVRDAFLKAYRLLKIGNPLDEKNHVGPLIDKDAVSKMQDALRVIKEQGGKIIFGGEVLKGAGYESECYVVPALVEADAKMAIVHEETFAPILYLVRYSGTIADAIHLQNDVKHGLSSAIFSNDLRETEEFLSAWGSDCGIANVNIGTSGAEIGGAFGGEKDTGGGRESGSDSWKAYMRRQTNTINFGGTAPLAQGIRFEI